MCGYWRFNLAGGVASVVFFTVSVSMSAASAVEVDEAPRDVRPAGAIEEIIVTTQRRAETLQRLPLAVSSFSGEDLQSLRIDNISSLAQRTPSLTISNFKPGAPQIFIRGIGSNERGAGGDQSVILFVDEVYVGRGSGMELDLFDLERVEVLRGPQGTLFGKNVIGGAINLITRNPSETPELGLSATYGNLNEIGLRGFASGPLANNVYGKIAFSSRSRDGFMRSEAGNLPVTTGFSSSIANLQFHPIDTQSLRAQLRATPSDNLEINLRGDVSTRKDSAAIRHFLPGPGDGGSYAGPDRALVPEYERNIYLTIQDKEGSSRIESKGASLRIDYDFSERLRLTSITGYRSGDMQQDDILGTETMALNRLLSGASPGGISIFGEVPTYEKFDTLSQELRFVGGEPTSRVQWIAGVFAMTESIYVNESADFGVAVLGPGNTLFPVLPQTEGSDIQDISATSLAGYAQATYAISDRWNATVGARYSYDRKKQERLGIPGGLLVLEPFEFTSSDSWSALTPRLTLDYQLSDDFFVYTNVSNGYKAGGYQGLSPRAISGRTPFKPEDAWLYEIGARTQWLDSRLILNATVHYTDYKDLQIRQSLVPDDAPAGSQQVIITSNAGSARIRGFELEYVFRPIPEFTLSGSYAYLDTEFTSFSIPPGFSIPAGVPSLDEREGNSLLRSPKHAFNTLGRYERVMPNGGRTAFQAEWRYQAKSYGDPDNLEFGAKPAFRVLAARVSYALPGGNTEVSLWAENLLDEEYFVHVFPNLGSGWATPAAPRTYGITVNWRM